MPQIKFNYYKAEDPLDPLDTGHLNVTVTGADGTQRKVGMNTDGGNNLTYLLPVPYINDGKVKIEDEYTDEFDSITVDVTQEKLDNINNYIASRIDKPDNYWLAGNSCRTFAQDIWQMAGKQGELVQQWDGLKPEDRSPVLYNQNDLPDFNEYATQISETISSNVYSVLNYATDQALNAAINYVLSNYLNKDMPIPLLNKSLSMVFYYNENRLLADGSGWAPPTTQDRLNLSPLGFDWFVSPTDNQFLYKQPNTMSPYINQQYDFSITMDGFDYHFDDYGNRYVTEAKPVVLDLNGNGIEIAPKSSSNTYFDIAGDGYQHRTAWAGPGDGVLVFDIDGDGRATHRKEIVFTDWDPTATSDMQALANVFDTNHNGQLDAGDERFASFKIQVSNADGTQTVKTLAQAGVRSIDLTEDKTVKTFTDGSSIDGQSSFTRTNGTRGTAASTTFSYEAAAHQVDAKSILNPDGTTSIFSKAFDTDGDLASEIISTSSADGLSKTIRFDHDGDGVIDSVQNSVTVIHSDGAQTNTLSEHSASAVLLSHATEYISADGKTILSLYDSDGNGTIDQREIDTTHDDASRSITVTRFDSDGSISESVVHVVSADGQIGTTQADFDGDGIDDLIRVDWTVINEDGSRTQTITDTDAAGSLLTQSVRTFGADGKSQIFKADLDGDNVYERTQISTISSDVHGTTTIQTNLNADGAVSYTRITNIAADGSTTISVQDSSGSEPAHTLIGDTGANTLVGNDGIEILNGGDGPDILSGRAGADTFVFSTRLGTSNIDHLNDFSITDDTIQLGRNVFGGLGLGQLDETAFKELSAGAVDATDRIIYDKRTGDLFYDADGSGTVSTALQFAIVDNKAHLTAADFFV
ncbi:hypothetical protein [Methylobacterium bullatum]|uniref:Poly(Beta-D-mannuronate) C5 epimerase 1 n=1 Tax=Methylobacterium bullatum TaxID=570505 RepID=A0A679JPI9_9HYPH|nr:Poly(beta-D-mannuronate) C5 epimerase 1 [Methylobacterium bullatum]